MRVNLLVNTYRPEAVAAAQKVAAVLRHRAVSTAAETDIAEQLGVEALPADELAGADLLVSFGGDGTLIRAAHLCSATRTPILGVHFGRFGFVTQCSPGGVERALERFLDGKARFEDRMMLQTEVLRGDEVAVTIHSLNESALQRSATTRMTTYGVTVNGVLVARYPADGILVSTPTGSTAYSLSAGGPVLDPKVQAMVLIAMMPHTLSARPFVLGPDSEVVLSAEDSSDVVLSADGHTRIHLATGDRVRLRRSPRVTRLVTVDESDFLRKLTSRLLWSRTPYEEED